MTQTYLSAMRLTFAACVVLLSSASLAADTEEWCEAHRPPPEHRQDPTVEYEIIDAPRETLVYLCGYEDYPEEQYFGGCVERYRDDKWFILLNDRLTPFERACVIEHEKGHLPPNNWKHDDGTYVPLPSLNY